MQYNVISHFQPTSDFNTYISCIFGPKLAENCPKPSEILRIAKKRCFHRVPRPKNVLCTNFQPKMMILIFWPVYGDPLDPGGWEGPIFQVPQGSKSKSFQDILRGPYRCEKSKKPQSLFNSWSKCLMTCLIQEVCLKGTYS